MLGIFKPLGGIGIDIGSDAVQIVTFTKDMVVERPLPKTIAEWRPAVKLDTAGIVASRYRFEPLDDVRERWVLIITGFTGRREDTEVLPYDGPLACSISQLGCV
jgi:hypothetical protein